MEPTDTSVETSKARIWRDERGFVRLDYRQGVMLELEDAIQDIEITTMLTGASKGPIMVDLRPVKSVSSDARGHYSSEAASRVISKAAFLIKSPVSRMLGNIFLGLNRPPFTVRLFTSEQEACAWLLEKEDA